MTSDARSFLLRSLTTGQTGCIRATVADGTVVSVYVMMGEVLAAHAEDDVDNVLLRLFNGRSLTMGEVSVARRRLEAGENTSTVLSSWVADAILADHFHQRFRENLYRYLHEGSRPVFEPLDAVMVDNIQVGHDTSALVDDLVRLGVEAELILRNPDVAWQPGDTTAAPGDESILVTLAASRRRAGEVLQASPFEPSKTAMLLRDLIRRGVLVPVSQKPTTRSSSRLAERLRAVQRATALGDTPPTSVDTPAPRGADLDVEDTADDSLPNPRQRPQNLTEAVRSAFKKAANSLSGTFPPPPAAPAPAPAASRIAPTPSRGTASAAPVADAGEYIEVTEEMSLFEVDRGGGRGSGEFSTDKELLDVVDLGGTPKPEPVDASRHDGPVEMPDVESAGPDALAGAVTLNFAGPRLHDEEARRKVDVANEVLGTVARALDDVHGLGLGRARLQLLVEGTPGPFAPLFKKVEVDETGHLPVADVLRNLRKRPASEHRRLLNRGLNDLIERALSLADESLDGDQIEALLERIAGFQQRFGM